MKKRWKRLISILLMCCMMVGMLPTIALAEDNEDETQEWLFPVRPSMIPKINIMF